MSDEMKDEALTIAKIFSKWTKESKKALIKECKQTGLSPNEVFFKKKVKNNEKS